MSLVPFGLNVSFYVEVILVEPKMTERRVLTHLHKTSDQKLREMRQARDARQAAYNVETRDFEEKRLQKEQQKRLEKLKRYKGIGELGNRMTDNKLTDGEKFNGVLNARYMQQEELLDTVNSEPYQLNQLGELKKKAEKEQEKRVQKLARYRGVGDLGHRLGTDILENVGQHLEHLNITETQRLNCEEVEDENNFPDFFRELDPEEEKRRLKEFEYYKKKSGRSIDNNVNIYQAKSLVKRNETGYQVNKSNLHENTDYSSNLLGAASIPLQKSLKKEVKVTDEDSEIDNILKLSEQRDAILSSHKKAQTTGVNAWELDTFNKSLRKRPAKNTGWETYNDVNRNNKKISNKQMNIRQRKMDSNKTVRVNHASQDSTHLPSSSPEDKELGRSPEKLGCRRQNEVPRNVTSPEFSEVNIRNEPNVRMSRASNLPSCSTAEPLNEIHTSIRGGEIGPKLVLRNAKSSKPTEVNTENAPTMKMSYPSNLPSCSTSDPYNEIPTSNGGGEMAPKLLSPSQRLQSEADGGEAVKAIPPPQCRAPTSPISTQAKGVGQSTEGVQPVCPRRLNEEVQNSNPSDENSGSVSDNNKLGGNRRMFGKGQHPLLDKLTRNANPPE